MSFNWDVANPGDTDVVSGYPNNERTFRTAARASVHVEHDAEEGRHTFGRGTTGTRNGITTWADGAVWWNTSLVSGETIFQVYDGAAWLTTEYGLLDVSQSWTTIQSATYTAMGITGPALDLDWDDGHYQKYTMASDLTLGAGSNLPTANEGASIVLELTQDGTGTRTLAYNAEYVFQYGIAPTLTTAIGAIDVLTLTLMSGGNVKVSAELNVS